MSAPPILLIESDERDPVGPLGEWLADAGVTLVIARPFAGDQLPADLSGYAGLIAMGGRMSADADEVAPWLPTERALLAQAVAAEVPTLGVCLGHQLLALPRRASRPEPTRSEIGAQLIAKRGRGRPIPCSGLADYPGRDPVALGLIARAAAWCGALAARPGLEVQAFRLGRLAWGIQFHIETTPQVDTAMGRGGAAELADSTFPPARAGGPGPDRHCRGVAAVRAAFVAIVRDPGSVRPARRERQTTAEPITDPAEIRAASPPRCSGRGRFIRALPGREHAPDSP